MSYNFNAKAKRLIASGHLIYFETVLSHGKITPALMLYFDNHSPIAIEKNKWKEYSDLITSVIDNY